MLFCGLVLSVLIGSSFAGRFLDQSQSGVVTTYQIPSSGVWQSFTPAWNSSLSEIDLYFGAAVVASACIPYVGTLTIYAGQGSQSAPYFNSNQILLQQDIQGSCKCTEQDCLSWQTYVLKTPIPVMTGLRYSFMISGPPPGIPFRIGVSVADVYQRGINDFPVPGYDYTFQLYVDTPQPGSSEDEQTTVSPVQNTAAPVAQPSSPVTVIAATTVGVVCFIALVAIVVIKRRQTRGRTDPQIWLSVNQAAAELKARFGDDGSRNFLDGESSVSRYHRRYLSSLSSFDEVVRETAGLNIDANDDDIVAAASIEPTTMNDKSFVWDQKENCLKLVDAPETANENVKRF